MEFTEFLGALPTALVPVALVLFFTDQNTKKWMEERRELALAILNERKEWLVERKDTIERQFAMQDRTVLAIAEMSKEDHAQRNELQQVKNEIAVVKLLVQELKSGGAASD